MTIHIFVEMLTGLTPHRISIVPLRCVRKEPKSLPRPSPARRRLEVDATPSETPPSPLQHTRRRRLQWLGPNDNGAQSDSIQSKLWSLILRYVRTLIGRQTLNGSVVSGILELWGSAGQSAESSSSEPRRRRRVRCGDKMLAPRSCRPVRS